MALNRTVLCLLLPVAVVGCGNPDEDLASDTSALTAGNCGIVADSEICVCEGAGESGACAHLGTTQHFFSNGSTFFGVRNDAINSVAVGAAATATLCTDAGYLGACTNITPGMVTNLSSPYAGQISSIRVDALVDSMNCHQQAEPRQGQAYLYTDANWLGDCVVVGIGSTGFGIYPSFTAASMSDGTGGGFGIPQDRLSSAKVGPSTNLWLFDGANFNTGTTNKVLSQSGDFNPFANKTLAGFPNDKMSSLKVF